MYLIFFISNIGRISELINPEADYLPILIYYTH